MSLTSGEPASTAAIEQILGCKRLPSLPWVAVQILELTRDQNATSADIAKCVEMDQALSGKILKTINSSFYGLSSPCPTIGRAINYLGMKTVRSLVLGFSLADSFRSPDGAGGFDLVAHWRRAMYGAVAARLISSRTESCDGDEAFIAAMLRDVGSLAAAIALGDAYTDLFEETEGVHSELARCERRDFGSDHAAFGEALTASWNLPEEISLAISRHHDIASKMPNDPLTRAVFFASLVADAVSTNDEESDRALQRLVGAGAMWYKLDNADIKGFMSEVAQSGADLSRLFDINTGSLPDIDSLLEQADEQKLQIQIEQEQEEQRLRESNDELAKQRFTDGLTGVQNRAAFDEALYTTFRRAEAGETTLTIAFSDADKFKSLNDTHGHQAGDAVLIELAKRMSETLGDEGRVYRYGGEEFAMVFEGMSIDESVHLAERVRKAICDDVFHLDDLGDEALDLRVTASIGVAVYNEMTREDFPDAEALLKGADDAVYQAKESGRNRVCLYHDPAAHVDETAAPAPPANEDGKLRVLVVDDDPLLLKLLSSAFESTGMAEVRTATTVTEAVKLLHFARGENAYLPHLVVTDLNMPEHSGVKLVRYMRATKALLTAPVVVLSGSDQAKDIRECLRAGANAYLPKTAFSGDPKKAAERVLGFWSIAVHEAA